MSYVQLGWIQDAIDYVFDKILNPVFEWLSSLLSEVFGFIFDTVLGGVLETVIGKIVKIAVDLIWTILARFFYAIERALLTIVDMLEEIFEVLAGVKSVTTIDNKTGSLLSILVRTNFVTKTILIVVMVSFVLCMFFSVLATIKSISDMGGEGSKPVGHVLRMTSQAMLRMIMIPLIGLFMIVLGDALLTGITHAMTMDEDTSIARTIFCISTLNAVKEKDPVAGDGKTYDPNMFNSSTRYQTPGYESTVFGLTDVFRGQFYRGEKSFRRWEDVEATFDFKKMDFFLGIGLAFFFIMILGTVMFIFVSRIFDVIVLLIIEPLFVCQMPLDDGEAYKKWSEMFIGKLFAGYGMVVAMYLYLLVAAQVFTGDIAFTPPGEDIIMDYLMKMILLIGGGFAVMQAGPLVTSILSVMASMNESATMAAGSAFTGQLRGVALGKPVASFGMDIAKDAAWFNVKKSGTYQKMEKNFEGFMDSIGLSDPKYHEKMARQQQMQRQTASQHGDGVKFEGKKR
ncbi:MAG: hypothetical protein IK123_11445 [Lachnospiraceae bacterium]|nr:hypothetical protein [Lachnospiraceae bacterium]